jgi:hypothetical protein
MVMDATYPTCLDTADDATACAFFWTGLALGILHVDASKEWAYARIDARDAPAIEIIEIATARDRNGALDALQAATGDADWQTAGRWLLRELLVQFRSGRRSALETSRAAMQVASTARLPEEVYYAFDDLDGELVKLANGIIDTAAEIEVELVDALEKYSGAA